MSDVDRLNAQRALAGLPPVLHDTTGAVARSALHHLAEDDLVASSAPRHNGKTYIHRGHIRRGERTVAYCTHSHATKDLADKCARSALGAASKGKPLPRYWSYEDPTLGTLHHGFDYAQLMADKRELDGSSFSDDMLINYARLHIGQTVDNRWSAVSRLVEAGWTRSRLQQAHA